MQLSTIGQAAGCSYRRPSCAPRCPETASPSLGGGARVMGRQRGLGAPSACIAGTGTPQMPLAAPAEPALCYSVAGSAAVGPVPPKGLTWTGGHGSPACPFDVFLSHVLNFAFVPPRMEDVSDLRAAPACTAGVERHA